MMEFKGAGPVGDKIKDALASSNTDEVWVKYIPSDGKMVVRFLTAPDEWFQYFEHWNNSVGSYFACLGDGCPGCAAPTDRESRTSKRFLANVLDVEQGRVIPLKLPVTLADRLYTRYERYESMTDRDYTLWRVGTGLNTDYDLDVGAPDALDVSRYSDQHHDLQKILEDQFTSAFDKDPEEAKADAAQAPKTDVPVDDEPIEEEVVTVDQIREMPFAQLEEIANEVGVEIDPEWSRDDLVEALIAEAE